MQFPNVVALAVPFFVVAIVAELITAKLRGSADYETRDMSVSLLMGLGNLLSGLAFGGFIYACYQWLYSYRLFDLGYEWWVLAIAVIARDFVFYWGHRLSHEVRWFWAAHVVHHSSQHYHLATALRQPWAAVFSGLFVLSFPVILIGVPPEVYIFASGINLVYQFWIHTEVIDRLGPLEWIFNTPSHHRVHHAVNPRYLDANYAGMFIVWDRLFGTFVAEEKVEDPPVYGLVTNIGTFHPLRVAFHEYLSIARDLFRHRNLQMWWGYLSGPPGWSPDGSRKTTAAIKQAWKRRMGQPQCDS